MIASGSTAARVRSLFLTEPDTSAGAGQSERLLATIAGLAVLGTPRVAGPVAAALALRLGRAAGAGCALVAGRGLPAAPRITARPAAARAAAALEARDIPAHATGGLVVAPLDDPAGLRSFGRAAAAVDGPAVLLVTTPRSGEVDELLAEQDALVLALAVDCDPVLAELAETSLSSLGRPVHVCRPDAGPLARRLAATGVAVTGALRGATRPPLEAVR